MSTAYTYDFLGQVHHLSREEFDAIELTGRSGTVQQYAMQPGQYLHRNGDTLRGQLDAMEDRPGKTEISNGLSNPDADYIARRKLPKVHLRRLDNLGNAKPACGASPGSRVLADRWFERYCGPQPICKTCSKIAGA